MPGVTSLPSRCLNLIGVRNSSSFEEVAQRLRIHLPMQATQVRSLVQEDPICHGATKPMRHNYWDCSLEPASHNYWARVPQLLKPACLEPVLRNRRSQRNEKPTHCNEEWPPLAATRESPTQQQRPNTAKNKYINKNLKKKKGNSSSCYI